MLSRKGFDASAGGVASPIFYNGSLFYLPIPQKSPSPHKYKDLSINGISGISALNETNTKLVSFQNYCHFDPMLIPGTGIFGQAGASQTELKKNSVGEGDLFLFFGWFKQYAKKGPDIHHLYGWLQIDQIIDGSAKIKKYLGKVSKDHPHGYVQSLLINKNNTIYVGKKNFIYDNKRLHKKGYGLFKKSHKELILTEENCSRSKWKLPKKYFSKTQNLFMNRLKWKDNEKCLLDCLGYGQEFILDTEKNNKVAKWATELIKNH